MKYFKRQPFDSKSVNDVEFMEKRSASLAKLSEANDFRSLSRRWLREAGDYGYFYNFDWLGRPIIQVPHDIYAIQEIIWEVKPDLVIETGVARGGSLVLSASLLALIDYCQAVGEGKLQLSLQSSRQVLGIDIDIRDVNRQGIENHALKNLITLYEGSSVDESTALYVERFVQNFKNILVILDSNHTKDHVLRELEIYAPLVSVGSYCIVMDTSIDLLPAEAIRDRPWGPTNNPRLAVKEFLERDSFRNLFAVDKTIEDKIMVTGAIDGFLKRF